MKIKIALLVEDYAQLMKLHERDEKFIQFMSSAHTKTKLYKHNFYLIMTWEYCLSGAREILREFCEKACGDYISVDVDDNIVCQKSIGLIDVDIRIIEAV